MIAFGHTGILSIVSDTSLTTIFANRNASEDFYFFNDLDLAGQDSIGLELRIPILNDNFITTAIGRSSSTTTTTTITTQTTSTTFVVDQLVV